MKVFSNIVSKIQKKIIYKIFEKLNELNFISSEVELDSPITIKKSTVKGRITIKKNSTILDSKIEGNITILEKSTISETIVRNKINIGKDCQIRDSYIEGKIDIGDNVRVENVNAKGFMTIESNSSLWGPNISLRSIQDAPLSIGKFCSIARNVSIQTYNHNYDKITSYFIGKNIFGEHWENEVISKGKVTINNDVWIGSDCIILGGISIGNGAIVAANSLVNKNVPDYAIVGGTPAKIIGYRFDEEIIEQLKKIEWWNWDIEKIKRNKHLFETELTIDTFNQIIE